MACKQPHPSPRACEPVGGYLAGYVRSEGFLTLDGETEKLKHELGRVTYVMTLKGSSIRVSDYDPEDSDYGAQVEHTFERFKQGPVQDHRARFASLQQMGHVEAAVLEFVAKLHPELFAELTGYCERHSLVRGHDDRHVRPRDPVLQRHITPYIAPIARRAGLTVLLPAE